VLLSPAYMYCAVWSFNRGGGGSDKISSVELIDCVILFTVCDDKDSEMFKTVLLYMSKTGRFLSLVLDFASESI